MHGRPRLSYATLPVPLMVLSVRNGQSMHTHWLCCWGQSPPRGILSSRSGLLSSVAWAHAAWALAKNLQPGRVPAAATEKGPLMCCVGVLISGVVDVFVVACKQLQWPYLCVPCLQGKEDRGACQLAASSPVCSLGQCWPRGEAKVCWEHCAD